MICDIETFTHRHYLAAKSLQYVGYSVKVNVEEKHAWSSTIRKQMREEGWFPVLIESRDLGLEADEITFSLRMSDDGKDVWAVKNGWRYPSDDCLALIHKEHSKAIDAWIAELFAQIETLKKKQRELR